VLVLVDGDAMELASYISDSSSRSSGRAAPIVIVFCSSVVVVIVVVVVVVVAIGVSVGSDRIVVIFLACALLAAAFALKKFSMVRVCERVASGTPVRARREEGGEKWVSATD